MCIEPVGDGAMRVTTGFAGEGLDITDPIEGVGAAAPSGPPGRAALITLPRRLPSLAQLWDGLRREIADQWERVLLWTPVAFGAGAAVYMGLPREPDPLVAWIVALAGVSAALAVRRLAPAKAALALSGLAAIACLGFLAAKLHSDAVAAPIAPTGVTSVDGYVVDVEAPSERGPRLLIAPVDIEGLAPARTPVRVRLVVPQDGGPEATPPPGSTIRVLTLLDPPPGPAAPGSYDFARDAWFEGVGGVGLALRPPEPVGLAPPPLALRLEMAVNAMRWTIASHLAADIHQVMGINDRGASGLAAAVTTSHQDWLPSSDRDALRGSGLAHMLAIAGLHTAAVSGFAFLALRLLVAGVPWLSLRVSGKKVAAAGGLVVVAAYLLLSGAHPPARRAAITAGAAFIAILADRQAFSLHSLALAAFAILLIEPEAVLQPGFEMSFCATASLVAMAGIWPRRATATGLPWALAALQKGRDWAIALCMVSFVAGAATGPFAIQHFNRVSNYGVFANLTADFLASAVLMPLLAICLIAEAMDAGAGQVWPLFWLAGWAARGVISIGHFFSEAPGAGIAMSSAPTIALAISYVGIVFACLWRGRLRWIGVPLAFAVALWPRPPAPAAWIAGDGGDAAIIRNGQVIALKPQTRLYATQTWAQHRGLSLPAEPQAALEALYDCDRAACKPKAMVRPAIAAWWTKRVPKPERIADLCRGADILILRADVEIPAACGGVRILTRNIFEKDGAAEVFAAPGGWRFEWSQPLRGERPWSVSGSAG